MNRTKKLASRSASIMLAAAMSTSMIATVTASAAEPTDEYIGTNATKYVNPTKKNTPDSTDRTRLRVFGIDDPSATVVAYQNNDPNRAGRPSYEIICRANKVVIRNADYQYNYKDFS